VQYGLTLKYEFKHINRWRPYLLAGIIAAQMDPLDVKFKFKGKKPNEEQIYEARVAEGSNKIQGINFAAGLSYRISNRWSAFADANYLKIFKQIHGQVLIIPESGLVYIFNYKLQTIEPVFYTFVHIIHN
jgi:hypothetical protein